MWMWTIIAAMAAEEALSVDRWTSRDGLPQNSVTDILQDQQGYVWVTTFGGIARFDGVRFEVYDPATVDGLSASRFLALAEGGDGTLWFGSESDGLFRYDGETFTQVPGVPVGVIHDLHVDADGLVWVAADAGVHVWDGTMLAQATDVRTYRLASDATRVLASQEHGDSAELFCLKGDCAKWSGLRMTFPSLIDDSLVGLLGNQFVREDGVGPIQRQADLPWWFGASPQPWQGGVWVHDGAGLAGWTDSGVVRHPLDDEIRSMMVDRENGLWLGTNGKGLLRVRRRGVTVVAPDLGEVAAVDGGVYGWSCGRGRSLAGREYPAVVHDEMCGFGVWTSDERLWFTGSIDGQNGLHSRSEETWRFHLPGTASLVDANWAFVDNMVYRLRGEEPEQVLRGVDFGVAGALRALRPDGEGGLWARSAGGRIFRLNQDLTTEVFAGPAVRATVRDVYPVEQGLWVGTYGGGLHLIGDSPRRLDRSNGLCDNSVSHFHVRDEFLWMNTNRGFARVALEELDRVAQGEQDTILCELVDSGEGNGLSGALFDGRFYVPTLQGVVGVDPNTALPPPVPPRVAIDSLRCGRATVLPGDTLQGPCDLNIDTIGLSFDDPLNLRFRHRLRPSDPWSDLTMNRHASFVDLEPGPYEVQVQAQSARGVWSDILRVPFDREPLWWETPVARVFAPVLFMLTLIGVLLLRVRSTTGQNRELRREVEQRLRAERELVGHQKEKQKALEDLAEARRLEAIGRLAAGVGHDFNNLLMVVLGRMETIRTHSEVREDADVVIAAAQRAAGLTSQLLTFGRQSISHAEHLEVGACIDGLRPVLERLCGGASLLLSCEGAIWVKVDKTRLEQLLTNLVVNARDANASTIHVTVAADGPSWMTLEVRDDGDGMPDEVTQRVFEPYFTTKGEGRGTGLGMATVHGVAEEAGGHVRIVSTPGEGTTVTTQLPRFVLQPRRRQTNQKLTLRGIRVLVVDDDTAVLETVAGQLRAYNAIVEVCSEARLVPDLFGTRVTFDVLVSDVMMPGLNGAELEQLLRDAGYELPILFISGYLPSEAALDTSRVLRKPFAARTLASRVSALIRTPDPTGH